VIVDRFPNSACLAHKGALLLLLLAGAGLIMPCRAQDTGIREIKIPYALSWGDSAEKIRGMIAAVKARETACSEKGPGTVVIEAEGLGVGDPLLKKSLFTFREGSLVEVELQYGNDSWDGDKAVDFFDRTRRRIDERYGAGTLMVNKVKEVPPEEGIPKDLTYTMIIYRWTQAMVALELNFYSMEGNERAYRIVSLHYKTP
jgi:hypothetical protein